jgi:hypothetical protein
MGINNLNDYLNIESYCKNEGLNTEYFIISSSDHARHTKRKKSNRLINRRKTH